MGKPKHKFDTAGEAPSNVKHLGKVKKFNPQNLINLTPLTESQSDFLTVYYQQTPIILQKGSAGTGKTFLAIYAALSEIFEPSSEYKRLIIIRSAVESRKIGFLKGTEEDKMEPFERPYRDIIDELIRPYKNNYENLKSLGLYDFMLTSHQRGNTYDNAIIIIDEVQNLDASEIRTVVTRAGKHSKIILCGDSKQDDLERQREKSGFGYIEKIMKFMPHEYSATIEYTEDDIVRSNLVKQFLIADAKISD